MWTTATYTSQCVLDLKSTTALHRVLWSWSSPSGVWIGCPSSCQMLLRQHRAAAEKYSSISVPLTSLPPSALSTSRRLMPEGSWLVCLVRFATLNAEGLGKEWSDSTWWCSHQPHIFTSYLTENPGVGTGFSKEDIPQQYCLEFLSCFPMGEIPRYFPCPFLIPCHLGKWTASCARAMLLWLYLLSWAISCPTKLCYKMCYHGIPGERLSRRLCVPLFGLTATRNHSPHCCHVECQLVALGSHPDDRSSCWLLKMSQAFCNRYSHTFQ